MVRPHARASLAVVMGLTMVCSASFAVAADAAITTTFAEAWSAADDNDRVTAVGIRAPKGPVPDRASVLVLVDTSASQAGQAREDSLESLAVVLASLRPNDAVAIAAVDVSCVPLTTGFHAPQDPAVGDAVSKLKSRAALGSTDFTGALDHAADALSPRNGSRFAVYIGDGPGVEGVDAEEFAAAIARLAKERIAVSTIGVGARVNWAILAATAANSGGLFSAADAFAGDAAAASRDVAPGLVHAVTWPTGLRCRAGDTPLATLPSALPPLRSDRDTVVLVGGNANHATLNFEVAEGPDATTAISLSVPQVEPRDEHAYLGELARNAAATRGVFLPLTGRQGLELARRVIRFEAGELANLARQAEQAGIRDSAIRLAEASLRRDPDNQAASIIRQTALKQPLETADPLPETVPPTVPAPPEPGFDLAEVEARRSVRAQQLERDVAVRLREARTLLTSDPDRARNALKDVLETIRASDDLDPAARERLRTQVEARIRESEVRSREKLECDLAAERKAAIGRERARLTSELEAREARIKQLMLRYNELVEEGIREGYSQSERYPKVVQGEAITGYEEPSTAFLEAERTIGDQVLRETGELYANYPIPMPAREMARTAQAVAKIREYHAENFRTRLDQERGFMDQLHLVDVAAIPYPDDPPIIYPNAESWAKLSQRRSKYKPAAYDPPSPVEKRIQDALDSDTSPNFTFQEASLQQVKALIEDEFKIPVVFDLKALEGVDINDPQAFAITENLPGMPLRSALRQLLGNRDLAYVVKDDALRITTKETASEELLVRAYPVGDLVIPISGGQNGVNPFNLGGTNNQGQNNALQGGGGVGGGGGGNVGGFCWLAREVYGLHDGRWLVFRDWMMSDAPSWLRDAYAAHGEAAAAWTRTRPLAKAGIRSMMDLVVAPRLEAVDVLATTTVAGHFQVKAAGEHVNEAGERMASTSSARDVDGRSAQAPPEGRGLPADILSAADIPAALAAYLNPPAETDDAAGAAKDARLAAGRMAELRASAGSLGRLGDYGRAADLLSAAIACGHGEPWMYESLAVAMEAAGRPRDEIDRVLLSTADLSSTPSDLLHLASYLARFGSDQQAMRICRKIVRIDPTNREAYALAMTVAGRLDDLQTLAWACPGVLTNEWPAADQEIVRRAGRLAKATVSALEKADRNEEADALRAALDAALIRDFVVDVTWSGDADIDIMVEEPTGSVCSRTAPRSPAGGLLLGDTPAVTEGDGTHHERYVATFGFPGDYRVLVKRVAGKVAGDTVTVEMTVMKGTDREKTLREQVRVTTDEQVLVVKVPDGRRHEPLGEAQVVQDVRLQQVVGRTILAQQLATITDAEAMESMSRSRESTPGTRAPAVPFSRGGAVGYQPVITTLPEGLNHSVTVVVSPDRRYVRCTCNPFFSGIGQVTTFTFSGGGGGGGMGGGGMGGGGMGGGGMGGGGMGGGGMGGMGGGMGGGGMGGGGMGGMGGGMGGGGMGGFCWVAREVYGDANPKWLLFRSWLQADAPRWLHAAYAAHGQSWAEWIRDRPAAKAVVRFLMDRAIAGAASPWPDSE